MAHDSNLMLCNYNLMVAKIENLHMPLDDTTMITISITSDSITWQFKISHTHTVTHTCHYQ